MYIKNIIIAAAVLLNKPEIINYIESNKVQGDVVNDVEKLLRITSMVITELSTMGIYALKSQTVSVRNGKVVYTVLRNRPIHILYFEDENGNRYDFKMDIEHVEVDDRATNITFAYAPINEPLDTRMVFSEVSLTDGILGMGVCAEYLLTLNDFDSAVYWHQKYQEEIEKILAKSKETGVKNVQIKERSFS